MVSNTVNATYIETYDLNTAVGEMSMLGIHTPQAHALKKMYKGYFEQYKRVKIHSCDIAMVCASTQQLTPDLVGMEAGSVDPRDVLNPILFRACTGETIDALVDQIYDASGASAKQGSMDVHRIDTTASTAPLTCYYNFLADDSWRKFHPQSGLVVRSLKPFVHKVVTTQPFKWTGVPSSQDSGRPAIVGNSSPDVGGSAYGFGGPDGKALPNPTVFVSNGLTDMPWLDTCAEQVHTFYNQDGTEKESADLTLGVINNIPKVWCGAIILPPAILQRLFFRLQIRWHVSFKDFRPAFEVGPIGNYTYYDLEKTGIASDGAVTGATDSEYTSTYFNLYHSNTSLKQTMSSFDCTSDAEITPIGEKAL